MFGNHQPSEVGYYEADSAYGKMLLRKAQRTDTHVYRILSTRLAMDITTLKAFTQQDTRIEGQERERMNNHYRRTSNELRDMLYFVPEAVMKTEEMTEVAELLVEQDKM